MRVSISKIKLFKACRRAYELKYIENLVPIKKADALETGKRYHELLEGLYKDGDIPECKPCKELAMALAYKKYIFPKFNVKEAEKWFEYELDQSITLVGQIDGIAEDGAIVEHKTTGQENLEEYEFSLMWDEQLLAYMLVTGARKVYYTIIKKPSIRQKQNESDDEFFERMCVWYDEDTEQKIKLVELTRTDEEVEEYRQALEDICGTMQICEMNKDIRNNFYRNTCHCSQYGRRCEYSGICLEKQLQQNYTEFERREDYVGNQTD